MNKQLTLFLDAELGDFANHFEKENDRTISQIVALKFKHLWEKKQENLEFSDNINELYGIFEHDPLPNKKILRDEFHANS